MGSVIIVHNQTSGGQTVFTALADFRDGFTNLLARLSAAAWLTELAALGNQDVNCVLLDNTENSVMIVYNQTSLASPAGETLRCFWKPRCGRVFLDRTVDSGITYTTKLQVARQSSQVLPVFTMVSQIVSLACPLPVE